MWRAVRDFCFVLLLQGFIPLLVLSLCFIWWQQENFFPPPPQAFQRSISSVSHSSHEMNQARQWVKSVHLTGFYQMTCNTPTLSTCFSLGGNSVVPLSLCLSTRSSLQNFVAGLWIQNDSPCTGEQLILRAACPRDSHPPHYNKWKSWRKFKKVWVFSSWQPSCTHPLLNCQPWGLKAIWRCSRNRNTSPAVEES